MPDAFVSIKDVNAWYGRNQVLYDISLEIPKNSIFAFIGPSGCGKTTLLRSINRMNDLVSSYRITGDIVIAGVSVFQQDDKKFVEAIRKKIGMVFQQPNLLPMTVLNNMLLPLREHYSISHKEMVNMVIEKLKAANIYGEVSDRLHKAALKLSGGQQQRVCIARSLLLDAPLLLLDEPCSALDLVSMFKIEELLISLKEKYSIIMVTHNMEQARRISDYTAFFYEGRIIEQGSTHQIFTSPQHELTQRYIR